MKRRITACAQAVAVAGFTLSASALGAELQSEAQRLGYTIGQQVGESLMRDGIQIDQQALFDGIADSLSGKPPQLTQEEKVASMQKAAEERQQAVNQIAEANRQAGEAFLANNREQTDVAVTGSGLQYRVIESGKGEAPAATDSVTVNYRGTTIDGEEFDSSYSRGEPATFRVNQVIPGWQEALQLMSPGAKWQVFIPSDLAYGERGAGGTIGPNATLVFDIELLAVN
ncbi:MAG: FKBP-type peptidyl-prolyl cis-trans isomerase [Pseudomonadota bacterium]|nr:FKBP-type peptidyl-prolyl cis-trans isomerase [Pseudomonadota bacterium]